MRYFSLFFLAVIGTVWLPPISALTSSLDRPQYICLNKGFPGGWLITDPSTFTQASIDEVLVSLNGTRGSPTRRLCISFNAWTLYADNETSALESISALLGLCASNDLPLSISLDATQWWQGRPDLFNFYDPAAPGFNAANTANVEWSAPAASNATAISWRNWGSQFRMATPHPNFASAAFRAAAAASMAPLARAIAAWYAALPPEKRYLLAYVRATQELWIGTNYYYYADGNSFLPQPPSGDPTAGIASSVQLGYAAVCGGGSGGSCASGAALSSAQLDAVVSSYAAFAAAVLADAGIPRSRIMVHTGAFWGEPPTRAVAFNSPSGALVGGAQPAWSMYAAATRAEDDAGLAAALDAIDGAPWGSAEWLASFDRGQPQALWAAALNATQAWRNNRLVVVQNFESVRGDGGALAAIAAALDAAPPCLVDAPTGLFAAQPGSNASALQVTWSSPALAAGAAQPDAFDVAVSSLRDTLPSGALAVPNVAAAALAGGATSATLPLPPGYSGATVYVAVVARGCAGAQTAAADAIAVTLL